MEEGQHEQSEQPIDQVNFYKRDCGHPYFDHCFSFFQENKSYGIKTIYVDPLSTRC